MLSLSFPDYPRRGRVFAVVLTHLFVSHFSYNAPIICGLSLDISHAVTGACQVMDDDSFSAEMFLF